VLNYTQDLTTDIRHFYFGEMSGISRDSEPLLRSIPVGVKSNKAHGLVAQCMASTTGDDAIHIIGAAPNCTYG